MVWDGMTWLGMAWHGLVWFGLVWFGIQANFIHLYLLQHLGGHPTLHDFPFYPFFRYSTFTTLIVHPPTTSPLLLFLLFPMCPPVCLLQWYAKPTGCVKKMLHLASSGKARTLQNAHFLMFVCDSNRYFGKHPMKWPVTDTSLPSIWHFYNVSH